MNQISDCEHLSVIMRYGDDTLDDTAGWVTDYEMNTYGVGFFQLVSHKDLLKVTPTHQYVKDDCIYLQISKADNTFPLRLRL